MINKLQIEPTDARLLSAIRKAAAKGYTPSQVSVHLNLPYGPFMHAMIREPVIKHAWELGNLQYQTKYQAIAEEIAEDKGNKQRLAAAIYLHRHSITTQELMLRLQPEKNMLSLGETLEVTEVIPPNVMQLAIKNYDRRNSNPESDGTIQTAVPQ